MPDYDSGLLFLNQSQPKEESNINPPKSFKSNIYQMQYHVYSQREFDP